jgi:hypothetical protein
MKKIKIIDEGEILVLIDFLWKYFCILRFSIWKLTYFDESDVVFEDDALLFYRIK